MHLSCRTFLLAALLCAAPMLAQTEPEIAPGLSLPHTGMVVVLGDDPAPPKLVPVHPSEIVSNMHAAGNFARGMVYAGPKSGVELAGSHAGLVLRSATPVLYVRLASEDPETLRNRVTLLRMKGGKDSREVIQFSANVFGGQRKRTVDEVAAPKTDVPDSNWLKVVPSAPLPPGEYGIVFMPKDKMLFADTVYDFTVATGK